VRLPVRLPTQIAFLGNTIVAAATLIILGWTSVGMHATARNTARFSALWCLASLGIPALSRFIRVSVSEGGMIEAFVAAHAVHFVVVSVLFLTFERSALALHPGQTALVVALGMSLLVTLAITAVGQRPFFRMVRLIALSLASSIFFAAFFRHEFWPLRLIAVAFAMAGVLRLIGGLTSWTVRAKPV
jgi:hypothetical protein